MTSSRYLGPAIFVLILLGLATEAHLSSASQAPTLRSPGINPNESPCLPEPATPPEKSFFERILELFATKTTESAPARSAAPSPSPFPWPMACHALEVGEHSEISQDHLTSPTTLPMRYRLTRTGEKTYRATVNLKFVDARKIFGAGPEAARENAALNEQFQRKVNQCLKVSNRALKGPNGQSLEIALASTSNKNQDSSTGKSTLPPETTISILDRGFRSHSLAYSENLNCMEVTHEILHLLGLCDEYKERSLGYQVSPVNGELQLVQRDFGRNAFDCRKIGAEDNIMSQQGLAFLKVFGAVGYSDEHFSNPETFVPKPNTSLLMPEQFLAITKPGCGDNANYYACSANAYRTSKDHFGAGCAENTPSACRNELDPALLMDQP